MSIDYHTFAEALPVHQSPRIVLQVLWAGPEQLPMRNSCLAPDVLVAICRLLHCDDDALDTTAASSPEALWQCLDSRRDQWLSLLPAEDSEAEWSLYLLADPVTGLSWTCTAALSLLLGMHPHVGRDSPLGLLGPMLLCQVFAEHLRALVAAVAYCGPEGLHIVLAGAGGRTRELQPPPLGDVSSNSSSSRDFTVQLMAHTEQTIVVAAGPQQEKLWWVAIYAYDVHSGELINTFSVYGGIAGLQLCFSSATGRVAFLACTGPALVVCLKVAILWETLFCTSVSGRHVYSMTYENISWVDVLMGRLETLKTDKYQGLVSYLLKGHQPLPDSLEDAVCLHALLGKEYCDFDDDLFLVYFDPQSGEVKRRKWSRNVNCLLHSTNSYSIQGDYAFAVQEVEGTAWLRKIAISPALAW
eukprot:m51a1_g11526 hypothetical protein (414) ;mRNA; r:4484-5961